MDVGIGSDETRGGAPDADRARSAWPLTCPVCHELLADFTRFLRCPRGHSFDRAREGYVDLLPTGHGRSGRAGDAPEMLRARRRFLLRGHYDPLADAIIRHASAHLAGATPAGASGGRVPVLLEVGCGEGFYIGRVTRALAPGQPAGIRSFGLDLSRAAVRLAARAYPEVFFFTNDVHHRICMADASVDVLLDVFAPRDPGEFARVLRPDGLLLVAIPGERHIAELRSRHPLIGIEPHKRERTMELLRPAFDTIAVEEIEHAIAPTPEDVADLLHMTPSYWHLPPDVLAEPGPPPPHLTIAFHLLRFRRR